MGTERIRLSKSTVGDVELRALSRVIGHGNLGMGSEVEDFERELADFLGQKRAVICVSTGTAALHLALQACGVGPGDEVLVPTLTYVASFQAVSATGARPVACDVKYDTGALDVEDAARRITPRTKAIMPVHYASGAGDLDCAYALAQAHGLRVIEDAAHAFGCRRKGRPVGATGDIVCFSFDGIKNITSGEGGAVITDDQEIAERVRDARLLGVEKDTEKRFSGQRSWDFDVIEQGWRYHMSNLCAAVGRAQLGRLAGEFAPKRIHLAQRYAKLLEAVPDVSHLNLEYGDVVPHIFPILVESGERDRIRQALLEEGIESGIHYKPNHLLSLYGGGKQRLPVAEELYQKLLSLPLHVELTETDQGRIVEILNHCVRA